MYKSYTHEKSSLSFDDICELVTVTYTKDKLKQRIPGYKVREVFCTRLPLPRQEYYLARQSQIRAEVLLCMDVDEYEDETIIRYNDKEYTIYKTYQRSDNAVELYCAERVGQ